jgi:hypothetical protein
MGAASADERAQRHGGEARRSGTVPGVQDKDGVIAT